MDIVHTAKAYGGPLLILLTRIGSNYLFNDAQKKKLSKKFAKTSHNLALFFL